MFDFEVVDLGNNTTMAQLREPRADGDNDDGGIGVFVAFFAEHSGATAYSIHDRDTHESDAVEIVGIIG